jgi:YcaO-like protein with predicted kinase domain
MTTKGYRHGTHRAVAPSETLRRIEPLLAGYGITRAADVTGLDNIGVPVFCAIRPRGIRLQVANGKGLRAVDAKVSALMESLELCLAEAPPADLRLGTYEELSAEGAARLPHDLPYFSGDPQLARTLKMHWVLGEELPSGAPVWVPASSVWYTEPRFFLWSTNGLASGNTVDEATLHALFEVYERHLLSTLFDSKGNYDFGAMQVLSLADAPGPALAELRASIGAAGLKFTLMRVPNDDPVHCFAAILIDDGPCAMGLGFGAHLSYEVAAVRAITEAVQSRLGHIHASREDLGSTWYGGADAERDALRQRFAKLTPDTRWEDLRDHSTDHLDGDLDLLVRTMRDAGLQPISRVVLSPPDLPVAVVRALARGAKLTFLGARG